MNGSKEKREFSSLKEWESAAKSEGYHIDRSHLPGGDAENGPSENDLYGTIYALSGAPEEENIIGWFTFDPEEGEGVLFGSIEEAKRAWFGDGEKEEGANGC